MKTPVQICPTSGGTAATTQGTAVSNGSTNGVKGSWAQLIASTDTDACGLLLYTRGVNSDITYQVELGVGGSGSEQSIGDVASARTGSAVTPFYIPVAIPQGSRLAARSAGNAFNGLQASVTLVRGRSFDPLVSRGRMYGWSATTYTTVDGGASANTKGAWAQISASTTNDAKGFSLILHGRDEIDTDTRYHIDVGVGGAGSEQLILADFVATAEGFRGDARPTGFGPIWTPIPAASRLAMRLQANSTDAENRTLRCGLVLWE